MKDNIIVLIIMFTGTVISLLLCVHFVNSRKRESKKGSVEGVIALALTTIFFFSIAILVVVTTKWDGNSNMLPAETQQSLKGQETEVDKDTAATLFHEMRMAYKNNELSADDTYKGNRYIIIGEFDGVSEDGVFNKLLSEIKVTVKLMDGNTDCYVFCDFDAETWRDKLAALNKGDEMIIEGECYSWGSWSECELLS